MTLHDAARGLSSRAQSSSGTHQVGGLVVDRQVVRSLVRQAALVVMVTEHLGRHRRRETVLGLLTAR